MSDPRVRILGVHPDSFAATIISFGLLIAGPVGWVALYFLNGETKRQNRERENQ